MQSAFRLYEAYKSRKPLHEVGIEAFIANKLKNVGAHTLPR
jgi:hypothetical protein